VKTIIACFVLIQTLSALLRADIAPTEYRGGSVLPLGATKVRMEDADVKITWATPAADLEATFLLFNPEPDARPIEIGFPVGEYFRGYENDSTRQSLQSSLKPQTRKADAATFSVEVNGTTIEVYEKAPTLGKVIPEAKGAVDWFYFTPTLKPGKNEIHVKTLLKPTWMRAFCARLSYCIWTGGRWDGPIQHEAVKVVFPSEAGNGLVSEFTPKSGKINGKEISWEFSNIEPTGNEFDINVVYMHPKVWEGVNRSRAAAESQPGNHELALKYAIDLFGFGDPKANAAFPPEKLTKEEYAWVKQRSSSLIGYFYLPAADSSYHEKTSEWTTERRAMIQILADAGYNNKHLPGSDKIEQARKLVEKVLAEDPKNADAWAVYLAHYWMFNFAAQGRPFGQAVFSKPQRKAINEAFSNCPTDPRIQFWKKRMQENKDVEPKDLPNVPGKLDPVRASYAD
jgi:hypothetical protein